MRRVHTGVCPAVVVDESELVAVYILQNPSLMTFMSFSLKPQYIYLRNSSASNTRRPPSERDHAEITPPAKHVDNCSRLALCRLRTTGITNHGGVCQFLITRQVGEQFLQLNMSSHVFSECLQLRTPVC
jgi:hypothetical protein